MAIQIRAEGSNEQFKTANVLREAFWNLERPGALEHYTLLLMRRWEMFLPKLSSVAVEDGRVVGCAFGYRAHIEGDDGRRLEVAMLGPIGVLPECQRRGIGRRLIDHIRELARAFGFQAIVLRGDPNYYTRRGFEAAERFGVRLPSDRYSSELHICELVEGAVSPGRFVERSIEEYDAEEFAAYDRRFPKKEKMNFLEWNRRRRGD